MPEGRLAEAAASTDCIELEPFYHDGSAANPKSPTIMVGSRYFWEKWAPRLGPTLTVLICRLRMHCYFNQHTQERRDWCFPSLQTLAKEVGVSRWTVQRELKKPLAGQFVRVQRRSRYDPARRQTVRISSLYHVAMDDPVLDEGLRNISGNAATCSTAENPPLTGKTAKRLLTTGSAVQTAMGPGWGKLPPKDKLQDISPVVVDIAQELVEQQIAPAAAARLAREHPTELIRKQLQHVRQLADQKAVRNVPGFLRRAIEENYQFQSTGTEGSFSSQLLEIRAGLAPAVSSKAQRETVEPLNIAGRQSAPSAQQGGALPAEVVWERTKSTLRAEMTAAAYEQWVESTKLLDYEVGKLRLLAPDLQVQRYLQRRLAHPVEAALRAICGRPTVLEVVCSDRGDANEQT